MPPSPPTPPPLDQHVVQARMLTDKTGWVTCEWWSNKTNPEVLDAYARAWKDDAIMYFGERNAIPAREILHMEILQP